MRKVVLLAVVFLSLDRSPSRAETPAQPTETAPAVTSALSRPAEKAAPAAAQAEPAATEPEAQAAPAVASPAVVSPEAAPSSAGAPDSASQAADLALKALGAKVRGERVARAEAEGRAAAFLQALAESNQRAAGLERRLEEQGGRLATAAANEQQASQAEARATAEATAVRRALADTNSRLVVILALSGTAFLLVALGLTFVLLSQRRLLARTAQKDDYLAAKESARQLQNENSELREELNRKSAEPEPATEAKKDTLRQQLKLLQTQLGEAQEEVRRLREQRASGGEDAKVASEEPAAAGPTSTRGAIKVNPGDRPRAGYTLPGMVPRKGG